MNFEALDIKLRKLLLYPINRIQYKDFGFKSIVYKPYRVLGKEFISLGKRVTFYKGARIECIKSWGGGNL